MENYNGVLSKKGTINGNFFKFVCLIQNEELFKSKELEQHVSNQEELPAKRKRTNDYSRSLFIDKLTRKLDDRSISPISFLELITDRTSFFKKYDLISSSYDSEEDETEEGKQEEVEEDPIGLCAVCKSNSCNILCLPCKHLKICSECHLMLQASAIENESSLQCVICRAIVLETIQVFN